MSGAWTQLEQLLTCAICLDRYRNPKLLPCHHTYCQEPCLEGLVDYARRQIKCPECRAEHRIPYQGVSTFPTNVTLVRFLELHRSITGEEPEPIPSMMERCAICSEKSSVERCAHCDKKICSECKEAHLDILKRELSRINAQVRRALTRLTDSVSATEKNCDKLLQNKLHIREEIEEIIRRFVKDLKDKESKLLHELEEYASNESNSLTKLKEDLNIEAVNISSNCDLIEKHVLEQNEPWTDAELVEYKDIFLKTLDFLRNFDPDTSDYTRRIRFIPSNDLDSLKKSLLSFGELKLPQPNSDIEFTGVLSPLNQTASTLNVPSLGASNALMRSQSDHRLAAQFARNERSNRYLEVSGSQLRLTDSGNVDRNDRAMSPLSFRRSNRSGQDGGSNDKYGSRYGEGKDEATRYRRTSDYTRDWPRPDDEPTSSARDGERFKSRFLRSDLDDDELSHTGSSGHRSVRFEEPDRPKETPKVFDTLDAPRGPLSGVPKITDTTHLMNRLHELQVKMKLEAEKKADEAKYTSSSTTTTTTTSSSVPRRSSQLATRQPSEDEIDRQKKANQAAAASASSTTTATAVATTTASATGTGDKDSSVASVTTSSSNSSGTTGNTSGSAPRSTGSSYLSRRVSSIRDEEEGNSTSSATSATSTSATRSGRTGDIGTPPTGRSAATSGRSNLASDANSASSVTASTTAVTGTGDDDEDIDSSSSSALARLARRRKSSIANSTTTVDSPSTAATSTSRLVRGSSNSSSSGPGSKSSVSLSTESDHGSAKSLSTAATTKPSASLNNSSSSSASASAKNAASLTTTATSRLTGPKRQSQVEEEDEDEEEEEVDEEEEYEEEEEDEEEEEEEEEEEDEEEVEDEEEQEMRAESTDHTTGMNNSKYTLDNKINRSKSTLTTKAEAKCANDGGGGGGGVRSNVREGNIRPALGSSFNPPEGSKTGGNDACDGKTEEVDDDEVDYDEDEDEDEDDEFVEHLIFHPNTRGGGSCNSNATTATANENLDDGEDDVNILLERAARVRREFASGSSNSSLNSNDTISSNLRTLRSVAGKEVNDILTPLHGSNPNLNLRSNYARLKASQAASLDSSSNARLVDRQNASNNTYHPIRRFNTTIFGSGPSPDQNSKCPTGFNSSNSNSHNSNHDHNILLVDPSSPSHLSHLTSSSLASSSSMALDSGLSDAATRNARSVHNSSNCNLNYNHYYNRRLSSPVSPVCSFLSEEGGGSSSTDCYFDATPSFKSPSPPPNQQQQQQPSPPSTAPTAPARKRSLTSATTTTSSASSGLATSSSISPSRLAEDNKNRSTHSGLAGEVESGYGGRSSRSYSTAIDNPVAAGIRSSSYQYRTRDPKNTHDTSNATDHQISHGSSSTTSNPTSTWAQYLKSKYGSKEGRSGTSSIGSSASDRLVKSRSSGAIYSRSSPVSSDDESGPSSFSPRRSGYSSATGSSLHHSNTQSETGGSSGHGHGHGHGVASIADSLAFGFPRNMYLQKKRLFFKLGCRGTDKGQFTWPRAVTVGLNNDIVVADSSNHRVQVFDSTGKFKFQFGQYGTGEGEFDCLAGVAVNKVGQLIVSDRYNHRVQIFDAGGRFLRSFGTEGRADGKFSYPWGITTDSLGFIYVCDKENHRIQVFQSDGTFVGKFGSFGSRPGQLEHPHYIAVSNTNRVIVSDSNNHRIQIFDVNGRSLTTFGVEGSDDGQFKFPRGVAVDDQGYIIVGDSGNNRIQVFNPDGSFLRSFGSWGSADGEFKGLEGVAISSNGHILVCDRENHRIQVF